MQQRSATTISTSTLTWKTQSTKLKLKEQNISTAKDLWLHCQ